MNIIRISILILCIAMAGCQPSGPAQLSEEDHAAIEEVTTAFVDAFRRADWDAVAGLYAENAVLLPPNTDAVIGRAAILDFLKAFPPVTQFGIENLEIQGSGEMAVIRGVYTMTIEVEGMPPVDDHGKFVELRYKQADGSWPLQWDIFNSSVPAPGMEP